MTIDCALGHNIIAFAGFGRCSLHQNAMTSKSVVHLQKLPPLACLWRLRPAQELPRVKANRHPNQTQTYIWLRFS